MFLFFKTELGQGLHKKEFFLSLKTVCVLFYASAQLFRNSNTQLKKRGMREDSKREQKKTLVKSFLFPHHES